MGCLDGGSFFDDLDRWLGKRKCAKEGHARPVTTRMVSGPLIGEFGNHIPIYGPPVEIKLERPYCSRCYAEVKDAEPKLT